MLSKKVFIIHGRDLLAREAVAQVLRNLDLEPVVLDERVPIGQAWSEGIEAVCNDISFAVVIYKFDDLGAHWHEPDRLNPRVRQNVLFELGFMIGKLGRSKVCVLHEEGVEIPSDYVGAKVVKLGTQFDWKLQLAGALGEAGLNVDPNRVIRGGPRDQQLIRDQAERTRQIITDLRAVAEERNELRKQVRFSGFLSALAFGDKELDARRDGAILRAERDELLSLARAGFKIYCIISPPTRSMNNPQVVCLRLGYLLAFLKSGDPGLKNIYWSIAPRIESYVYVIGWISFLQGFKGEDSLPGFALTERRTSPEELHRQITLFDERFDLHSADTLRRCEQRTGELHEDLLRAVIKELEISRDHFCRGSADEPLI